VERLKTCPSLPYSRRHDTGKERRSKADGKIAFLIIFPFIPTEKI
jgi:hypothetical protein